MVDESRMPKALVKGSYRCNMCLAGLREGDRKLLVVNVSNEGSPMEVREWLLYYDAGPRRVECRFDDT